MWPNKYVFKVDIRVPTVVIIGVFKWGPVYGGDNNTWTTFLRLLFQRVFDVELMSRGGISEK